MLEAGSTLAFLLFLFSTMCVCVSRRRGQGVRIEDKENAAKRGGGATVTFVLSIFFRFTALNHPGVFLDAGAGTDGRAVGTSSCYEV